MVTNWEEVSQRKTIEDTPVTIQEIDIRAELKPSNGVGEEGQM